MLGAKLVKNCLNLMTDFKRAQSLSKRHHYIPQFYLKGFSSDEKHLFVLDKEASKEERFRYQTINSIAFQKHLYTYQTKSRKKETLEDMFSQIEGRAATVIRKAELKQDLTDQERNDFSLFLSFLWIRVPYSKKEFERSTQQLYEKIARKSVVMTPKKNLKEFFEKRGKNLTDKEIDDLVDFAINEKRSKITVTVPHSYWIKQMLLLGVDIAPALEIADWEFRVATKSFAFVTSDNPFLLLPNRPLDPFEGLGLLTPGAKKVIPISAKICLVIHEPQKSPRTVYTEADKPFFRKINNWIVKYSYRFVYSADKGKVGKMIKLNKELLKPALKRLVISG